MFKFPLFFQFGFFAEFTFLFLPPNLTMMQRTCSFFRVVYRSVYLPPMSNHPVGQAYANNCHRELGGGIAPYPPSRWSPFRVTDLGESCSCWGKSAASSTSSMPVFWDYDDRQKQMADTPSDAPLSPRACCFVFVSPADNYIALCCLL